jgi:hypothetical protein
MCNAIIFSFVAVVITYCFRDGISGNDFWWHIKTGEWICQNKKIPVKDIYSWYGMSQDIDWTAHEWLSEVILYKIYYLCKEIGIYILSIASAALMIGLIWHKVRDYVSNNILICGVYFAMLGVAASQFFYGRPQLFSFFLLFFELKCLYAYYENTDSKMIYFVPLISCLWSNLHGGSANLSYILCIVFLTAGVMEVKTGHVYAERMDRKSIVRLVLVTIVSVLAILVNPVGLEVMKYPYVSMGDNFMLSVIAEWQPPDAKNIGNLIVYFFPVFLMTIGFFTSEKKLRLIDIMIMFVFLYLFFRSVRFIMLWYIASSFYAFQYMPVLKVKQVKAWYEKMAVYLFLALMCIPLVMNIRYFVKSYDKDTLITKEVSTDMINVLKKEKPERLLNDYDCGGDLIFNGITVFIDSRADLYASENILKNGVGIMLMQQTDENAETGYIDIEKLFDKYRFDSVLMKKSRPFYSYMVSHSELFECVYEDETTGYFRVNYSR